MSPQPGRRARRLDRLPLDRFELAALAALSALSVAVLAGLLLRVWLRGGLFTGADGYLVVDPLQYLNWLRQAGEHGLVGNLYDLRGGPRSFVHPGLLVSGALHRLGLGLVASYMVWKPVAVASLFAGTLLMVRRHIGRRGDARLALALALFACSPLSAIFGRTGIAGSRFKFDFDFLGGELWVGSYLWGYLFTAIAVGLVPLALLAYERGRGEGPRRMLLWAGAAGLIGAWLQPWQGATFAGIVVVSEGLLVVRAGPDRRSEAGRAIRDLALPIVATAAPLVYYFLLSKLDASWELANTANDLPRWGLWITVVGFAPLAIPALLALRVPAPDFGAVALRAWPLVGLAIFYSPLGTFPFHALQGLTVPLVLLAVIGARSLLGERSLPAWLVAAAVLVLIVPGTIYRVDQMQVAINKGRQPHFLKLGEHDALRALDRDPEPGGVLTPVYTGLLLPAYTGRETWIGAGSWTPGFDARERATEALFAGRLSRARAEAIVRRSGARFVLSDCHGRADITHQLARITGPPRRFGCATLYRVRGRLR